MKLSVSDGLFSFDGDSVRYNELYISKENARTILSTWLRRIASAEQTGLFYLPFSLDDEYVEAFEASVDVDFLVLRVVRLDGIAYIHGEGSFLKHITSDLRLVDRRPEDFLVCKVEEFRSAVADALRQLS